MTNAINRRPSDIVEYNRMGDEFQCLHADGSITYERAVDIILPTEDEIRERRRLLDLDADL